MPRGGRRENAGKKSRWESGRSFSKTKVIRVPVEFAEQLLEIAHKLDSGESFDIDTKSKIDDEIEPLRSEVTRLQEHIEVLESRLDASCLKKERDKALANLRLGKAAARYKDAAKVLNAFIDNLVKR